MSLQNNQKIMKIMQEWPQDTVAIPAWFEQRGISRQLRNKYLQSGWITTLAHGAYQKSGDKVQWPGGVYALQAQAKLPIHVGAVTALSMQGMAHYARLGQETIFLFSTPKTTLPAWFAHYDWDASIHHVRTSFLPEGIGLLEHAEKSFSICLSTPERAIFECLYLAPQMLDLVECYQIMEGLATLRPKLVQALLEACTSIRVKRLFLYMAEKAGHMWLPLLDQSHLNLGKGDRSIVQGGTYIAKHRISVPKELAVL